jgi:predicted nucleic acid-binding protein
MGQSYLIDTNVISDFLTNSFDESGMNFLKIVINETPVVSFITKIELLSWKASEEIEKIAQDFISFCNVITINDAIVDNCIAIRREKNIKTPDAIIAATALSLNATIITNNTKDFENIKGVKFLNPYKL